jgi:PAS domain S-box-containing protein
MAQATGRRAHDGDQPPSVAGLTQHADSSAFHLLVESTVDYAIFMLDPQGRIISWNAGAERIKGYQRQEIIGKHFSVFYPADAIARNWPAEELARAEQHGRFEDEGWRVRKDGTRFWADVVITALRDESGDLKGFTKVTRDVTQRKVNQERIENLTRELERRVQELATTNHELVQKTSENESFVYSVSHDLRGPLVNLQGFSHELTLTKSRLTDLLADHRLPDDLRQEAATLVSEDLSESVAYISNAVRHLGNIIDGLLRLSRVGRVEYDMKLVDVNVVVAEILGAMQRTISESRATLQLAALPVARGDRTAIGQIFANLIGNALKSLDETRPGLIQVSGSSDEPPVFAVADNGIGIPLEYRAKMFQVFQHVHRAKSRGEGMGLAIVRRIVERHGGRIWFESTAGVGTTFFFTLAPPAVTAAADGGTSS